MCKGKTAFEKKVISVTLTNAPNKKTTNWQYAGATTAAALETAELKTPALSADENSCSFTFTEAEDIHFVKLVNGNSYTNYTASIVYAFAEEAA